MTKENTPAEKLYFEIADAIDLLDNVTAATDSEADSLGQAELALVRARDLLLGILLTAIDEIPAMVAALREVLDVGAVEGAGIVIAEDYGIERKIAAILSRIDGATPTDEREPAQNGPDGHCLHCGRDNRGHEGEPCADDCPQYHEAKGLAAPTDEPAAPTGEDAHRFTVIWGNIGDDAGKRLDHVTVKDATHSAIMDAAFACFFADLEAAGEILSESDRNEFRNHTAYDGFAILPGHVTDAPGLGF